MILNRKNIESSIKKDDNTWLYEIILPWIKRYFDSIIINNTWAKKVYWNFDGSVDIQDKIYMNNISFCISSFFDYKVACFIDLTSMKSDYFFFLKSKLFNFKLNWNKYFCFAYMDYKWKLLFHSDYKWDDFSLEKRKKKIIIINNIFWTEIFEEDISDLFIWINHDQVSTLDDIKDKKYLDLADFYIFDDYFSETSWYWDFYKLLTIFSNKDIKINDNTYLKLGITKYKDIFCPRFKINISIFTEKITEIDLSEIRKLLLSFLTENILSVIINNDDITKYFDKYITNISKTEIDVLDLDYEISDNIYNSDIKFNNFKDNILLLRYNYFKLKDSIIELNKIKTLNNNSNVKLSNTRVELTQENIGNTLGLYENKLKKIFELIRE